MTGAPTAPTPAIPTPNTASAKAAAKTTLTMGSASAETPNIFNRVKKKAVEDRLKTETVSRAESFTQEQLDASWQRFKELKSQEGIGDMEAIVLSRSPVKNDQNVSLKLSSALEVEILERFETELVGHLRKALLNDALKIEKLVEEIKEGRKLYTSKDKYDYLVEQNPSIKELKERLGLDFEY